MFAISTSDYAVACGDRPSSAQTRREKFLEKNDNQESSRRCVVTPCSIYIKRTPSSYYDIQCVDAVLLKVNKTPAPRQSQARVPGQNDFLLASGTTRVAKYVEFEYVVEHIQKVLSMHPSWRFKNI